MDQWMYFLKNSEIKDEFNAKGLKEAKQVLKYENMSKEDKSAYERHVYNQRIEISVIETAEFKGEMKGARKKAIEVATLLLQTDASKETIATVTKLTLEEIDKLERGEEVDINIDKDTDDE
jgi:predicted transposase/invertase (TIGR01784 family)